jgi:8-oxo-dGTP diphosphatase
MAKKYRLVVECIIEFQDRILLIERPKGVHAEGLLTFPGGKIENHDLGFEVLENAVKREVFEEVGIELIDPIQYVTSAHFIDSFGVEVIDVIFFVRLNKSSTTIIPSEREAPRWGWFTYEEIQQDPRSPIWLKKYLEQSPFCIKKSNL